MTLYVGDLYEEDITNGSGPSSPYISYYHLGPKLVGMRRANQADPSTNGQYRLVEDHLGSVTLVVDTSSTPTVVQRQFDTPYGQVAMQYIAPSSGSLTSMGYTGQRLDSDSNLMYYGV